MRVGQGYDAHRLVPGRKLMLGGVHVPFEKGLEGHSDADVLIHALCDALLGAAGLGDIGEHFSDRDPQWGGAASSELLRLTGEKVRAAGFEIVNADVTLVAQRPKIKAYKQAMADAMAGALSISSDRINVKATTTEGMGPMGREEGLAALAVALID